MTRRQLYQFVAELLPGSGQRGLLDACMRAMRILRRMPAPSDAMTSRLLEHAAFVHLLHHDDALGRIYQAMNAPALEAAYRAARRDRRKFRAVDIPAVTQLFTPRWVVEFLVHNTLGRLWLETHPDSRLELRWLVERPGASIAAPRRARDLTILDPACGTMNFGLVAVELLEAMYREELDRAGRSGWPVKPSVDSFEQIAPSILRHNLFGIDIDPLALDLARATIEMKLRLPLPEASMHLRCGDALFDDIPDRFDVIVTNPPYLSARNLPEAVVQRTKRAYSVSWRDACACFVDRSLDLLHDGGRAGILAMQSFMFTGGFERLRAKLDQSAAIETIAHFGGGLFDIGNPGTLQTAALVMRREPDSAARDRQPVLAFRLTDAQDKEAALAARCGMHQIEQRELMASPRRAWTYWLSGELRDIFRTCPTLGEVAPPRQGLATTDNARFVRYWWEVEPIHTDGAGSNDTCGADQRRWFPYAKGGRFRRWYEAPRHRVDWADDGAAIKQSIAQRYPYLKGKWAWVAKNSSFYGRGGVTYSYLTSGRFSARRLDEGAIFDVAGSALFPDDPLTLLGVLNSSTAASLLGAINPTVNFQVGDLAQLPLPRRSNDELRELVSRAIELQRKLDTFDDTTTDFIAPMPWLAAEDVWHELHQQLHLVESRINALVHRLYSSNRTGSARAEETRAEAARPVPAFRNLPFARDELARQWVSVALRDVLLTGAESFVRVRPIDSSLLDRVRECLCRRAGPLAAEQIDVALGGIGRFIERDFFTAHVRCFERRPVMWVLGDERCELLVAHHRATGATMRSLLAELSGAALPDGWDRFIDDGILINLAPLRPWVRDRRLGAALEKVAKDLADGRFAWSRTARSSVRAACSSARLSQAPRRATGAGATQVRRRERFCRDARQAGT